MQATPGSVLRTKWRENTDKSLRKSKLFVIFAGLNYIDMNVVNLGEQNSVLNSFIAQMRDKSVQKDSMRFRRNLERVGEIFAYEISRKLRYSSKAIETPLGTATVSTFDDSLVIAAILRAGLPLHQGLLNFFDNAKSAL